MAARSGSESLPQAVTVLWQCCGCKATFPNEKNAKIHVAFHVKAMTGGSGPAAPGPGPGRGPGGGRARGTNSDTRRPELERRRGRDGPGPQHHASDSDPSQSGCGHWPPAEHAAGPGGGGAAGTAKMQRIVFDQPETLRPRAGPQAGGGLLARMPVTASLSGAPAGEPASESESGPGSESGSDLARDSDDGGPLARARTAGAGASGDCDVDSESPKGGDHSGY